MLPVMRKRVLFPTFNDNFYGRNSLSSFFSDGADYSVPAVNIKENDKNFEIEVAAPGLNKGDFKINIEKNILTVSSEKEVNEETEKENFMRKEFGYNSFTRSFSIPETIDMENIKASHKNGILKIELPKQEEAKLKHKQEIKIS